MARTEFRAIIKAISDPIQHNGITIKEMVLIEPGYVDFAGEKRGKDSTFKLSIINDNIEATKFFKVEDKVIVKCYINGTQTVRDGKVSYFVNLSLISMEHIRS